MAGIVGIVTRQPRGLAEAELQQMVDALASGKSHARGTWLDESLGVYVGWSLPHDASPAGMPLSSRRGDVVLVFAGEDYRDANHARERGPAGGAMEGASLADLYEEDSTFPRVLNGRFQGIVSDRARAKVTLFNDRFGMGRVYYHESSSAFYFAAEAKAILKVRPELRTVDRRALAEFLTCGCTLENRTLFEGIHLLPPAAAWVFRGGRLEQRAAYFQPSDWEHQDTLEPEPFYRELRDVFSGILPRYFADDRRIGMSLTGGLDTRMIMAWQKSSPGALPCYSFGGSMRECQDVVLARRIARTCGQPYQVIPVGDSFLSRFHHYAEQAVYLTDGCAGVVHAADLCINEAAREIAPVRMTGNYGGEVLRRVRAFKATYPSPGLYCQGLAPDFREAQQTYASLARSRPLSFAVFKQAPWHHYGLLALEQTQIAVRTPFLDNDLVRTVFRAPDSACASDDVSLRLIADGDPALMQIRTDRGVAGNGSPLVSAVVRRLLKFSIRAEYAYGDGMPQWLARMDHLVAPLRVERLFLGWHKFAHYRIWYRDALSRYVREMLLDSRALSRWYVDRRTVEAVVEGHLGGTRNHTGAINQLLTLELFHRLFIDAS